MPEPKTILCIDTITEAAGISLLHQGFVHREALDPKMASEGIIKMIDRVLKASDIELGDLQGVMVIKGPGSFTGLRVGISVANQFSHQLKIPIVGLRTDEWWRLRAAKNTLYLQSMNRAEVYLADEESSRIVALELLEEMGVKQWMGELKFDHLQRLPKEFKALKKLLSIEETWLKASHFFWDELKATSTYALVEPFYGKKPNITQAKKR